MKSKVTFLAGAAVGYVLGARAGRARYEELKSTATDLLHSPAVHGLEQTLWQAVRERVPGLAARTKDRLHPPASPGASSATSSANGGTDTHHTTPVG